MSDVPLREQIARALFAVDQDSTPDDPVADYPEMRARYESMADAVLPLVAARDAERLAAITALRRPPAFNRDASSVRHGYNAALADVLAILRGTTDG